MIREESKGCPLAFGLQDDMRTVNGFETWRNVVTRNPHPETPLRPANLLILHVRPHDNGVLRHVCTNDYVAKR
jgi:hypothetical protein